MKRRGGKGRGGPAPLDLVAALGLLEERGAQPAKTEAFWKKWSGERLKTLPQLTPDEARDLVRNLR